MNLVAVAVYAYALIEIRGLVKRFELTMPEKKATCLHIVNLSFFLVTAFVATITELLMVRLYSGPDLKI